MNEPVYTVTQLTSELKTLVESTFPDVSVTGEIVGYKRHSSGHLYFTLKDAGARLGAVVFRGQVRFLSIRPEELEDGLQVVCRGRMNVYEPHGAYKLIVEQIWLEGRGALLQQIEELKKRLVREGLFDESRKRELPFLPRVIGIVTSETSAAIRDMLRIIEERFPSHVKLYPAAVQGRDAGHEIVRGLKVLDEDDQVDVIIVGRGGGAFEDLLPFSSEEVVRAIAACRTPVVSAVGHEIDFPLSDLAADRRAPTPTAAAQLVTPDRDSLMLELAQMARNLGHAAERRLVDHEFALADRERRLAEACDGGLAGFEAQFQQVQSNLLGAHPAARLARITERVTGLAHALTVAADHYVTRKTQRLESLSDLLEQLGPASQFKRGYSLVRRPAEGKPVMSYRQVDTGEQVEIVLLDGRLEARVSGRYPRQ